VAILDTGVVEDLAHLIKGYKDFVSGEDEDFLDNTGHGTKAVQLIKQVYNMAEIYIGRVFENDHANPNTTVLMAQVSHCLPHLIDVAN
jgi:subtilisin family serine protease